MRELALLAADLSGELADELSRMEFSPEKLEQTERRLDQIAKLCVKYAVPADGLEEHLASLEQELDALDNLDDNLDELKLPFPSPGILAIQGSNLCLLHWQANSLPTGKPF